MKEFNMTPHMQGENLNLLFSGSLNEHAHFIDIKPFAAQRIVLDLDGINHLNSTGIHRWVVWMRKVVEQHPGIPLVFTRCPRLVVEQMNQIQDFMPDHAEVESIYVPFFCEGCRVEKLELFEMGKEIAVQGKHVNLLLPKVSCQCQGIELDVVVERYFKFIERRYC